VQKGTLEMQFRNKTEIVNKGKMIVVPKGVDHCPKTKEREEVHVLLFEKLTAAHTKNVVNEKTQTHYLKI
jgi:quercetin dioxygenase-like cupin family protein